MLKFFNNRLGCFEKPLYLEPDFHLLLGYHYPESRPLERPDGKIKIKA